MIGVKDIKTLVSLILAIAVVVITVSYIGKVIRASREDKISGFWGTVAVLMSGAALLCSIVGVTAGALVARPSGDPVETVNRFFSCLMEENYDAAYACLSDYQTLGLEKQAQGENGLLIQQALKDSYSFKLTGECRINGLHATQQVRMSYLDLGAVSNELQLLTDENLATVIKDLPRSEIYDENDKYLPSVTDKAYSMSIEDVLSRVTEFYTSTDVELELDYRNGTWLLSTNQALLNALLGGSY